MAIDIYILKLQKNKYYVVKTTNFTRRIKEHMSGNGSVWTKKYKPIKVEKIINNANTIDEDRYVKEYMAKYGINNVRGGSYVNEVLDEIQIYSLQKEIWYSNDKCSRCGRDGHFVNKCYAKIDESDSEDFYYDDSDSDDSDSDEYEGNYIRYNKNNKCFRCGRSGHFSSKCYASTHIKGYII